MCIYICGQPHRSTMRTWHTMRTWYTICPSAALSRSVCLFGPGHNYISLQKKYWRGDTYIYIYILHMCTYIQNLGNVDNAQIDTICIHVHIAGIANINVISRRYKNPNNRTQPAATESTNARIVNKAPY